MNLPIETMDLGKRYGKLIAVKANLLANPVHFIRRLHRFHRYKNGDSFAKNWANGS